MKTKTAGSYEFNSGPRLHQREIEIARLTASKHVTEAGILDRLLGLFTTGFKLMRHEIKVEPVRIETTQLLAMAFNSLRWAQEPLVKGYYGPSVTMSRSAWECWLNGAYLVKHPDQLESWKTFKTRPKPSEMRVAVAQDPELGSTEAAEFLRNMNELYGGTAGLRFSGFSALSHPSWEAIRILVADDRGQLSLRVGPDYDLSLFRMAFDLHCTAALMASGLFIVLLPDNERGTFVQELDAVNEACKAWRRSSLTANESGM